MPEELASLLARALTGVGLVTFPASSEPAIGDATVVRLLEPMGIKAHIESVLSGTPSRILLVSTRRPEIAKELFFDAVFPWWLQGQLVILTPAGDPPPALDRTSLLSMIEEAGQLHDDPGTSTAAAALVRPGVDGDVMGILAGGEDFERLLLDAIQGEALRSGFTCDIISEVEFAERLA